MEPHLQSIFLRKASLASGHFSQAHPSPSPAGRHLILRLHLRITPHHYLHLQFVHQAKHSCGENATEPDTPWLHSRKSPLLTLVFTFSINATLYNLNYTLHPRRSRLQLDCTTTHYTGCIQMLPHQLKWCWRKSARQKGRSLLFFAMQCNWRENWRKFGQMYPNKSLSAEVKWEGGD